MRSTLIIACSIVLLCCKSSHKLTGTDYIDLSAGESIIATAGFPQELADSLGWGNLASAAIVAEQVLQK